MDSRIAAAADAFKARRIDEGAALAAAAIADAKGAVPAPVYRMLAVEMFTAGRYAEARRWAEDGLKRHGRDFDLWNILGVACRRLGAYPQALKALDQAQKLNPKADAPLVNRTNIYNDLGDGPRALDGALKLIRLAPNNPEFHRMAGIAYRSLRQWDKAKASFTTALRLQPALVDAWLDLTGIASNLEHYDEALEVLERGLAANPAAVRLQETKAMLLRRAGRQAEAKRYLAQVLAADGAAAWAHHQLGRAIADENRAQATAHLRRAAELQPASPVYLVSLVQSLSRSQGGDEGERLQEAYDTLKGSGVARIPADMAFVARDIHQRIGDFDAAGAIGEFSEIGRAWARSNNHGALLGQMARVETQEDRRELVEQHRLWGRTIQARVDQNPIVRPPRRPADGKIRLGFMSSDLRNHPVGYFALPLFDFPDERFELYVYSFNRGAEDAVQKVFASKSAAFRWNPRMADREAAQMIADDQLDMLIELGGSTHMNKLEVMAYRPARLSASWLGYPHSAGLEAIDHIVVDPFLTPEDPGLLIEKPMTMPHTWLSLGRGQFHDQPQVDPTCPEERNGFVTFGTANNPHKYNPNLLRLWGRVLAAAPNSQFLFVRPEAGAAAFRENMRRYFAMEGVGPERIRFQPVRGGHLPFYNEIDISLDTAPLTGGTTTCESLWMGVPVVSLIGEALFERLSYSILTNAGLGDLAVDSHEAYVATAAKLAADAPRRKALRSGLRDQIKASPLGQTQAFARDFYDMVAATVAAEAVSGGRAAGSSG